MAIALEQGLDAHSEKARRFEHIDTDDGAVLVRPAGYVGWRSHSMTTEPATDLCSALASILGRS